MNYPAQIDVFRAQLVKLPDLERLLSKLFTYSVRDSVKAVSFQNIHHQKLREYKLLLQHFRDIDVILKPLRAIRSKLKSDRLKQLLHYPSESFQNYEFQTN